METSKPKITRSRRRAYQVEPEIEQKQQIEREAEKDRIILHHQRKESADKILTKAVWSARGAGLIPVPLADFVALLTIQTYMVSKLSQVYEVDFTEKRIRSVLVLLFGSVNPSWIVTTILGGLSKAMPFVGLASTMVTQPIIAGASTYAVGKIFINHFELGGTLLDFDAENTRDYFHKEFEKGKQVVKEMKKAP